MREVLEGSHAVSEAVRLAKVQVMSAYPITPQTHIVEALSEFCEDGTMDARFICVESEHSAMAAVVGASTCGVRTFTATSSHGLALMHEMLHWASAARLPIVMAEVNRALGPGWNIWMDQTDSLAQRDTGWIQLYCENGQDVLDTTLQAFRLAEMVNLPVMVVLDAFFLSHTYEDIDVPDQKAVDRFLPPLSPRIQLSTQNPCAIGQMSPPAFYTENRHSIQAAMEQVQGRFENIQEEFEPVFGRKYAPLEAIECEDADVIMVMAGTAASTCREVISDLRSQGEKVGLLKLKMFRPFPTMLIRKILGDTQKVAVVDRNFSFGVSGIFAQEIKAALCNHDNHPPVFGYIAGLGGRDVTPDILKQVYHMTKTASFPKEDGVWIDLNN
ncbi:transketolase C-terminal domain-containing protein [Desulfonema magnum]|uniref:Pyruvate synthase, subunit alpha n=1 Tax=Desulfonema magnum TaxID=45655 RepID=A0A975BIR3_9BACT|nr:transketolase C-terminal domain-containing protein [Desulfonema magnum]QTA86221.1 Pyruvate synthase, subunit alpha [Desulfonema magnum]